MYQQLIDYIKDKSLLIMGFGREGRSSYEFIRRHLPEKKLAIADIKPLELKDENVTLILTQDYSDCINSFSLVLKSPGISVRDLDIDSSVEITCQADLFLRFSGCPTVGITGTKGKTTTSTLIHLVLKEAGIPTCLIGNIGVPVFEVIEGCQGLTPVIELSSHQLEFCHASPDIAVLTNIYEEHLDHYNGMEGYVGAKLNIFRNQHEGCHFICSPQKEQFDFYSPKEIKGQLHIVGAGREDDSEFLRSLCERAKNLVGEHNKQDIHFAAAVGHILGASDGDIERAILSFQGIPHRMEYVGCYRGIGFYNDAIATIPHAVMCAVRSLEGLQTLIIGGMDRGLDYGDFIKELEESALKTLICLPETGHKIGNAITAMGSKKQIILVDTMEQAVESAYKYTQSGHLCLLSPAASSYNRYKNFEHKGDHFKQLVKEKGEA